MISKIEFMYLHLVLCLFQSDFEIGFFYMEYGIIWQEISYKCLEVVGDTCIAEGMIKYYLLCYMISQDYLRELSVDWIAFPEIDNEKTK